MFFFPYRLDIHLYRLPFLTILVCLICAATFASQLKSANEFERNQTLFCHARSNPNLRAIFSGVSDADVEPDCASVLEAVRRAPDHAQELSKLAGEIPRLTFFPDPQADTAYKRRLLDEAYTAFEPFVPVQLTERLAYGTHRFDFVAMLGSTFAHGDLGHILGNLFFFLIFASCVESALNPWQFIAAFVVLAVVTSLAYSYSMGDAEIVPSIGLSGVAMGMMTFVTTLLPRARMWCVLWVIVFFRRFRVPLLLIAAWQVGWNIYDLHHVEVGDNINYVAHVSGALCGIAMGVLYRILAPQRVESMAMDIAD